MINNQANSELCIPIGPFPIGCHTELISEKDIEFILSLYNFFNLEWKDDAETTRSQVPETLRRNGLWITYTHLGERITERFIGTDMQAQIPEDWKNDVFWEKLDFEAILNSAEDTFINIINNLNNYPKFKEFLAKLLLNLLKDKLSIDDIKDLIELHLEDILKDLIPLGYLNSLILSVALSLIDNYLNSPSFKATLNKLIQDYLCNISIDDDILNHLLEELRNLVILYFSSSEFSEYVKNILLEILGDTDITSLVELWLEENIDNYIDDSIDNYFDTPAGRLKLKEVLRELIGDMLDEALEDYFADIQQTLIDMERVIANGLARHEMAITELQNHITTTNN